MQYTRLGRTDKVSRLCLGAMNFGTRTDEEEGFAIMDSALGHGLNFFDTADRYGREVGLGHTEELIGCLLAGPPNSVSGRARLRGFIAALEAAGYSVDTDLIMPCRADIEAGYEAARVLLSRHPEVNGLVCFNDIVAVGALRACRTLGLVVPDDVAVIGHDDIPMAELVTPALTTLRVSKYDLGANAVRMLLDRLQARNRQTEIVLKPELVVRESAP